MASHWHLWDCCHLGNLEGVKRELAKGADVNGKKDYWPNQWMEHADIPCLTAAVWSKCDDVVSLLLMQPGINVDATDYLDYTALHHAIGCTKMHESQNVLGRIPKIGYYARLKSLQKELGFFLQNCGSAQFWSVQGENGSKTIKNLQICQNSLNTCLQMVNA